MDEAAGGGAAEEDDQDQEGHREDEGDFGRRAGEGGEEIVNYKRQSPALVNFVTALAYHFCLVFPAAFIHTGDHLLAKPCI